MESAEDGEGDVFKNDGDIFVNDFLKEETLDSFETYFGVTDESKNDDTGVKNPEIDCRYESLNNVEKSNQSEYGSTQDRSRTFMKRQSSTYEDIQSFVQKDELLDEIRQSGVIHGLNNYIKKTIGTWEVKRINVAITGNSGVGKSSLINALRGLTAKSVGAAKVGLMETTTQVQKYKFPDSDKVSLWDLPGIGTQQFTKESYLEYFEFSKFDIVMVVTANRFLENDIWLAKQAVAIGKPVLFVRTKLDLDLLNAQRDDPDLFEEASCIETIRQDIEENVKKIGMEEFNDSVFIISSPERHKYDFSNLSERLKSLMNSTGKGICKLLLEYMERAVVEKMDVIREKFIGKTVVSVIFGALPIPTLEEKFGASTAREIRKVCLEAFSLDDPSLEVVANDIDITVNELKSRHLKTFNTEQLNDMEQLYTDAEGNRYSTFRKYSKYLVPVVGSVMSACKSKQITKDCQNIISGIMADDEFRLVQLRLKRLEKQLRPLK